MKAHRGRIVHVESAEELDERLAAGVRMLDGYRLHGLDLTGHSERLAGLDLSGATFLGCRFAPGDAARAEQQGALVLPVIPEVPVDVYRSGLYTAEELYDTPSYANTVDARAYAWSQQDGGDDELARTLHDHSIDVALSTWIRGRRLVGVMGGHAAGRGTDIYADAARLGYLVARERTVATGGGPGAMEAANLGAWLRDQPEDAVKESVAELATVPGFHPSVQRWADAGFAVRRRFPGDGASSLAIPTWHYGHEPPNVFAGGIAKYFRNATREAILLEICDAGIVFLPGAGGTVQEIFQDACENYYADVSAIAPMVLVGVEYWTERYPAWPLLRTLAKGRPMEDHIHLVDTCEEAAATVGEH